MEITLLDRLNQVVKEKGEAAGLALAHEQQLEDDRAAIKADSIVRVMHRDNMAATPAEKIVETDELYFRHRAAQRGAIVARFRADAEYHAAKTAAVQASLAPPDVAELIEGNHGLLRARNEALDRILDLESRLLAAKRETDLKQVALRRANGYLADRIRDVDELVLANRKLSAQLNVDPRKVPLTMDTLEQSRDSLTARGA